MKKLQSWMNKTTSKRIAGPILGCLAAWREDPEAYDTAPLTLPEGDLSFPGMESFLLAQHQLGWVNFIEGSVVWELQEMHGQYLSIVSSRATPGKWVSKLIRLLWDILHSIWKSRCNIAHAEAESAILLDRGQALDQAIVEEWELGRGRLPYRYSPLFKGFLYTLLHKPQKKREKWLEHVQAAKENYQPVEDQAQQDQVRAPTLLDRWLQGKMNTGIS